MHAIAFVAGEQFNHWTVIEEVPSEKSHRRAIARCECGVIKEVDLASVRSGQSRSCGTCRRSMNSRKHGGWKSSEYTIWAGIRQRCLNPKGTAFHNYGGRGIRVCERWGHFENFLADIGPRPSKTHSIERRDNDGDYEPGNCYWATPAEQQRNKRSNKWKRIVLLLAGDQAAAVMAMVKSHTSNVEISHHIARVYNPMRACA